MFRKNNFSTLQSKICEILHFLYLLYKFLLPFNESNKESSLQDKIIKQRLNQKISLSLQQNKPKDSIEDDPTSSSDV